MGLIFLIFVFGAVCFSDFRAGPRVSLCDLCGMGVLAVEGDFFPCT